MANTNSTTKPPVVMAAMLGPSTVIDRQHGVAQLVFGEDARGRQTFGLCGAHEVGVDDLEHRRPHEASEISHRAEAQHHGGAQSCARRCPTRQPATT